MTDVKIKDVAPETKVGTLIPARREYSLKLPIKYRGVDKIAGEKVKLNDRQAERLKESGHI